MGGAKLVEKESRPIGADIPGRWQHRRRRTAAEEARPDPEDPSGSGQRGSQWAARSWPKGKVGRSVPASLGDGSTGGEELQLKKRGQIRKTCQVARATWQSVGGAKLVEREGRPIGADIPGRWQHRRRRTAAEEARPDPEDPSGSGQRGSQWAARSWPKGKVGRSVPASLGDGSTGGEELQLKKRGQIRKTCQVARATWQSVGGAKLVEREGRPISARIPGRWQHRRRRA
ncbi:hypothetical protein [Bacillus sp. PM43]|uniref:hypothetical protein n=1 Tax=Bacillus sp. PM43 TaxID=3414494 RepID=UPI003DAA3E59